MEVVAIVVAILAPIVVAILAAILALKNLSYSRAECSEQQLLNVGLL
jgi:hypothetical protein